MNRKCLSLLVLLSFQLSNLRAIDNIITFFIKNYPEVELPETLQVVTDYTISKPLVQPEYLNVKDSNSQSNKKNDVAGIWALYQGFAEPSTPDGQIMFPRQQQSETVALVITKKITPVFIVGPATVGYWELDPDSDTEMYTISLEYDIDANTYYFLTEKVELPDDGQVSLQSIIIPADPKNVYVPEGATITEVTTNLTLPSIYIKKDFDRSYNASYTTDRRLYFKKNEYMYEENDQSVSKLIAA